MIHSHLVDQEVIFYPKRDISVGAKGIILSAWDDGEALFLAIVDFGGQTCVREFQEVEFPAFRRDYLTDEEMSFSKSNPIEAIKRVRERLNISLKEAKEMVDKYR